MDCDSIQVVRSVGKWSIGKDGKEQSIYKAYRDLITSAKKFIYIENQFFVSSATNDERKISKILKEIFINHGKKKRGKISENFQKSGKRITILKKTDLPLKTP